MKSVSILIWYWKKGHSRNTDTIINTKLRSNLTFFQIEKWFIIIIIQYPKRDLILNNIELIWFHNYYISVFLIFYIYNRNLNRVRQNLKEYLGICIFHSKQSNLIIENNRKQIVSYSYTLVLHLNTFTIFVSSMYIIIQYAYDIVNSNLKLKMKRICWVWTLVYQV